MTISTQEKIFAICTENSISEEIYHDLLRTVNSEIEGMEKANQQLYRDKNELTSKYQSIQRDFLENASKANSKLMSVYYLLDAVAKTGTHREKETVIMYMKVVIDGLVQRGPLHYDEHLPF